MAGFFPQLGIGDNLQIYLWTPAKWLLENESSRAGSAVKLDILQHALSFLLIGKILLISKIA